MLNQTRLNCVVTVECYQLTQVGQFYEDQLDSKLLVKTVLNLSAERFFDRQVSFVYDNLSFL